MSSCRLRVTIACRLVVSLSVFLKRLFFSFSLFCVFSPVNFTRSFSLLGISQSHLRFSSFSMFPILPFAFPFASFSFFAIYHVAYQVFFSFLPFFHLPTYPLCYLPFCLFFPFLPFYHFTILPFCLFAISHLPTLR